MMILRYSSAAFDPFATASILEVYGVRSTRANTLHSMRKTALCRQETAK